ncbi:MAG: UDP-N-acetylglucosamine 2-epimerase [Pseudonocardiaceae bacterium]
MDDQEVPVEKLDQCSHVCVFIGARPNVPKAATIQRAFEREPFFSSGATSSIIHTGQHSNPNMGTRFAHNVGLRIDVSLGAEGGGTDAAALGILMQEVGNFLLSRPRPSLVVVIGDVNSTVAAAIVSARLGIPVAHVEAGLRSGAIEPEEVNRRLFQVLQAFTLRRLV